MLLMYTITHRWNGQTKLTKLTFRPVCSEQLSVYQPYKIHAHLFSIISFLLFVCLHLYSGCIYSDEVKYVILTLSKDRWCFIDSMVHP